MDIVNKRFNLQSRYIDYHTSTELPIVNRNEEDISGYPTDRRYFVKYGRFGFHNILYRPPRCVLFLIQPIQLRDHNDPILRSIS